MKKFQLFGAFLFQVLLLALTVSAPTTVWAAGDTNEIWISARTNALGTGFIWGSGSITDPFYGDFNAIMGGLPTNTTIHLLPGIHYTSGYEIQPGDFTLKANQKVIGSGIDVTIVRRDVSIHPETTQNEGEFFSSADGIEISDLTVDASGVTGNTYKNNGMTLSGNYCAVRRVKIVNLSGNTATHGGQESFGVNLGNIGMLGNIISECEVSSAQGDYTSAFLFAGQGVVENNRVLFPIATPTSNPSFFAYTTAYSQNAVFTGNFSQGGYVGFRTDTGTETNLVVIANIFKDVGDGIFIGKSTNSGWLVDGVLIKDNIVELRTGDPAIRGISHAVYILNQELNWQPWQKIRIVGNTMRYSDNTGLGSQPRTSGIEISATVATNIFNIQVLGNKIDRSFTNSLLNSGNWWADNVDLSGVPILAQNVGAGSSGSVFLNSTDGSVYVTATTTTNITLPAALGFSAKEVRIINQKSTGSLIVNPPAGSSLIPSNSLTISTNQTAAFISDGVNTWIRE